MRPHCVIVGSEVLLNATNGVWLVVAALGACACDAGGAEAPSDAGPAVAAGSAEPAPSASVAPEPPPAAEPRAENAITFASKRVGSDGFALAHVEAAQHSLSTGAKDYVALIVHLANYDRQRGDYLPDPSKDGHRRITLNFASKGPLAVGTYPVGGVLGVSNKLSVGIHARDEHIGLINGRGEGEITYLEDGKVRGKVRVEDDHGTRVEASFDTAYTVAPKR